MTKTEFKREAAKAHINPNLYGLIIDCSLPVREGGRISGGKVVGIKWFKGWKTEKEYQPAWGREIDTTFESSFPYVVLRKDRKTYHVRDYEIRAYCERLLNNLLISKVKAQSEKAEE